MRIQVEGIDRDTSPLVGADLVASKTSVDHKLVGGQRGERAEATYRNIGNFGTLLCRHLRGRYSLELRLIQGRLHKLSLSATVNEEQGKFTIQPRGGVDTAEGPRTGSTKVEAWNIALMSLVVSSLGNVARRRGRSEGIDGKVVIKGIGHRLYSVRERNVD